MLSSKQAVDSLKNKRTPANDLMSANVVLLCQNGVNPLTDALSAEHGLPLSVHECSV